MTRRPDSLWPAVHEERRALIEDLTSLPTPRWRTTSLCAGWDVHQAVAHLVDSAKTTRLGFVTRMAAARFDFDRDNATGVTRERADNPAMTLDAFWVAASRTSGPPAPRATRLVEVFVHGEDIRRPLGIRRDYPISPVIAALRHQLTTTVKMGGGRERARGRRLIATDGEFDAGGGADRTDHDRAPVPRCAGPPLPCCWPYPDGRSTPSSSPARAWLLSPGIRSRTT